MTDEQIQDALNRRVCRNCNGKGKRAEKSRGKMIAFKCYKCKGEGFVAGKQNINKVFIEPSLCPGENYASK